MTQPKKPEKLSGLDHTQPDFVNNNEDAMHGFNKCWEKMDAYYRPIVEELVEALKDLSDSIDDGTTLSGQRLENVDKIIAKYKAIK